MITDGRTRGLYPAGFPRPGSDAASRPLSTTGQRRPVRQLRPIDGASYDTVEEVAGPLRVSPSTVYRLIHAGRFPAVRVGKRLLVPREAVAALHAEVLTAGGCVDVAEWAARWAQRHGVEAVA